MATWQEQLEGIEHAALAELEQAADAPALEHWRTVHLGKRSQLSDLLSGLGKLPKEERASVGQAANRVKKALEAAHAGREATLRKRELGVSLRYNIVDVSRGTSALITFLHIEGNLGGARDTNKPRALAREAITSRNLPHRARIQPCGKRTAR